MSKFNLLSSLLLVLALQYNAFCQQTSARDSLQKLSDSDTNYVYLLYDIGFDFIYENPDSSIFYAKRANEIAQKQNFKNGILMANNLTAIYHITNGEYQVALEKLIYQLAEYQKLNNAKNVIKTIGNISVCYNLLQDYQKSIDFQLKMIEQCLLQKDSLCLANTYFNLGSNFQMTGQYDLALQNHQKSLQLSEKIDLRRLIASNYNSIGHTYFELKKPKFAISWVNKALPLYYQENNIDGLYNAYVNIIQSYALEKNYKKALSYQDSLQKYIDLLASNEKFYQAHLILYEINKKNGDIKSAFYHLEKSFFYKDSLINESKTQEIAKLQTQFETQLKEQKIKELEQDKKLEKLLVTQRNYQIVGIIIVFLIISIVAIFLFTRYKASKKKQLLEIEIKNKDIELAKVAAELKAIKAQMNPHFMFNALDAIQNLILQQNNQDAVFQLQRFALLTRKVLTLSTQSLIDLEDEIDFLNNYIALEKLRFGNEFMYEISADPQLFELDFRIPPMLLQPIAENAIIHGLMPKEGDKKLLIHFTYLQEQHKVEISITDNGVGFDTQPKIKKNHISFATDAIATRINLLNQQVGFDKYQIKTNPNPESEGVNVVLQILF